MRYVAQIAFHCVYVKVDHLLFGVLVMHSQLVLHAGAGNMRRSHPDAYAYATYSV